MSEFIFRVRATANGIVDLAGNTWTALGHGIPPVSSDQYKFSSGYSIYCDVNKTEALLRNNDGRGLFTPSDTWTFSAWIRPIFRDQYCTLMNGSRARGYQQIRYRHAGYTTKQPGYIPSNASIVDGRQVLDTEINDGNWHHVAVTQDGNGHIRSFLDGELLRTQDENEDVDWQATSLLYENRGESNTWCAGYFDDLCLIDGEALWLDDFTPPTNYLSLSRTLYKDTAGRVFGNNNGTFGVVAQDWTALTPTQKEELFDTCNAGNITESDIATINDDFNVLVYDEANTQKAVFITAIPFGQTIIPSGLIDVSGYSAVKGVTVTANISGNGTVKMAVTNDKITYYVYTNSEGVSIDLDDIATDGMPPAQIGAIPQTAWAEMGSILGFVYYLSVSSSSDVANTDAVALTVDMQGVYKSMVQGTSYDYEYPANNILRVKLYDSGDYKINYAP